MNASSAGARPGAPQAIQGADRFHLLQTRAAALDQVFSAHGKVLTAVREALRRAPVVRRDGRLAVPVPPPTPPPQAQRRAAQRRARRLATSTHVWRLHRPGWSNRAIARPLGVGRMTVARALQAPTCPERKGRSASGKSLLTPDKARLLTRWNAGCREARRLVRDLQHQGYTGSYATVARDVRRLRQAQGVLPRDPCPGHTLPLVMEVQPRPLTTRRATRLVLKRPPQRSDAERPCIAHLQAQPRDLAAAIAPAQEFCVSVRERQADRFAHGLAGASASGVAPLQGFAAGLLAAYEAGKAGVMLPRSTGPVEGQIHRLKMLKRSMFGRAKLDRLSRRCLLAASPQLWPRCQGPTVASRHGGACGVLSTQAHAGDAPQGTRDAATRMRARDREAFARRRQAQRWSSQVWLRP